MELKVLIITVSSTKNNLDITPIPNVEVNRKQLSAIFKNNTEEYETVKNPTLKKFGIKLVDFLEKTTNDDTIIVYYAGHGLKDNKDKKVYLQTNDSIKNRLKISSYSIEEFVDTIIKYSSAKRKIIIIDSCYSGAAHTMGDNDDTYDDWLKNYNKASEYSGVYILTATNSFEEAYFPDDKGKPTYFTGELLDILKNGLEDTTKEFINFKDLFDELTKRLLKNGLPKPKQSSSTNVQDLPFWRNESYKSDITEPTDVEPIAKEGLSELADKIVNYIQQKTTTNIGGENVVITRDISSIEDIEFDKIDFHYNKPTIVVDGKKIPKVFYGRGKFVEDLFTLFQNNHCVNVVAAGGMGKTSVAHIYIDKYKFKDNYYDIIEFVTSNNNIQDDFNRELKCCITTNVTKYNELLKESGTDLTIQIDKILNKTNKKCLLIIDVNIDKEGLSAINLENMKNSWDILYLSRKKIKGTTSVVLPNFADDFDGAQGLFESIYKRNLTDEQYFKLGFTSVNELKLFDKIYYHPLLIEQLAAFGIRNECKAKSYKELYDVVSIDNIDNYSTKTINNYSICFVDKEETIDVCLYLQKLISWEDYNGVYRYILQHFVVWPYDYIPEDDIISLIGKDGIDIEGGLLQLTDKLILSQSEDNCFRMHGLLGDVLKREIFEKDNITYIEHFIEEGVYDNYISNIRRLSYSNIVSSKVFDCVCSSLMVFHIRDTNYTLYQDGYFLVDLVLMYDRIVGGDFDYKRHALAYNIKLIKYLHNYDPKQLYDNIKHNIERYSYGTTSLYHEWLGKQKGYYDYIDEKKDYSDNEIINNLIQNMIKIDTHIDTIGETYISKYPIKECEWYCVLETNPSFFRLGTIFQSNDTMIVGWYDCIDFIIRLNEITKLKFWLPTAEQLECIGIYPPDEWHLGMMPQSKEYDGGSFHIALCPSSTMKNNS